MPSKIQGPNPFIQLSQTPGHRGALFRLGEVFLGQVLDFHGKLEITLAAKGARFRAHTTLPLVPGNKYEFVVQQEQPRLILRVLDFDTSERSQFVRLWGLHAAARASFAKLLQNLLIMAKSSADVMQTEPALQQLHDLLPGLICSGSDSLNARWLTQQLSSFGLFWESKVARWLSGAGTGKAARLAATDLKGILLNLRQGLEKPDAGGINQELKALVAQSLEFVELQQRLNLLGGPDLGQLFWFIPGAEDQGLRSVEVFVEEPDKENEAPGRDQTTRLRLRVELSRLGPVEATVSMQQQDISCQLRLAQEPLVDWIRTKLPELRAALEECGFRVPFLECEAGNIQELPPSLMAQKATGSALLYVVV